MKKHRQSHQEGVRRVCDLCGQEFKSDNGLRLHMKLHNEQIGCFQCDLCEEEFNLEVKLKMHKNTKHRTKQLCNMCAYQATSYDELQRHMYRKHGVPLPPNVKLSKCDECDQIFRRPYLLKRHKLTHTGVKSFSCPVCANSFYTRQERDYHIKEYHKARDVKCTLCEKSFTNKQAVEYHMRSSHSEARPYSCQLCNYSCKLKGNLTKHRRKVHKEEVVTRHVLFKRLQETGKGYNDILEHMRNLSNEPSAV